MPCIYKNEHGQCSLYSKEYHLDKNHSNSEYGFSKVDKGFCAVDEDPKPSNNCISFESIDPNDDNWDDE